jgi:hypothetical protein
MIEKTQIEGCKSEPTVTSILPPCYDSTIQSPPPPSYSQSTRLYYKNQPYISDIEQATLNNQEQTLQDYDSRTWSHIARLPFHRRLQYYMQSWAMTVYDGRLVFFIFFILAAVVTLALVVSFITIPSLLKQ